MDYRRDTLFPSFLDHLIDSGDLGSNGFGLTRFVIEQGFDRLPEDFKDTFYHYVVREYGHGHCRRCRRPLTYPESARVRLDHGCCLSCGPGEG